jgi:hypothetical protein
MTQSLVKDNLKRKWKEMVVSLCKVQIQNFMERRSGRTSELAGLKTENSIPFKYH